MATRAIEWGDRRENSPSTLLISPAPKPVKVRLCLGREMPAGPTEPWMSTMGAPMDGRRSRVGKLLVSDILVVRVTVEGKGLSSHRLEWLEFRPQSPRKPAAVVLAMANSRDVSRNTRLGWEHAKRGEDEVQTRLTAERTGRTSGFAEDVSGEKSGVLLAVPEAQSTTGLPGFVVSETPMERVSRLKMKVSSASNGSSSDDDGDWTAGIVARGS